MSLHNQDDTSSFVASSQLKAGVAPSSLKYVPISTPLPAASAATVSITASEDSNAPCRRCLEDARPGEVVHLISYDPFPVDSPSPYRGSGPIFVHAHDCGPFSGHVLPDTQIKRLMSLRVYDEKDMMVEAEVVEGAELEKTAKDMLADATARYINVHNAKRGCYALRIERA